MPRIIRQMARLIRLCIAGEGGRMGVVYFFTIFGLDLIGIQLTLRLIAWTADFYNALQKLDVGEVIRQVGIFFLLTAITASLHLVSTFLRQILNIRWRRALTAAALDRWLHAKAYWRLWLQSKGEEIDNPDQRIADDCRIFVNRLTSEALELLSKIIAIFSYVALLWSLSTFPLAFSLFGADVEIPRYMVWVAPIYVLIASGMTHWLGSPLQKLNVEQQHREADFRFALARMREFVEPIALADGEKAERRIFDRRFQRIVENWRAIIKRDFILGCFTRPYMQTVLRIPTFLALPAFLAGKVTLGGLMQIGSAFQNVVTTLSWFIFSYRDLIELAAATARLDRFLSATEQAAAEPSSIALASDERGVILRNLTLATPDGRDLLRIPELHIEQGRATWIAGPSGAGKTTLMRALAGLWPHGSGAASAPRLSAMFLPQQPYAPLDTLAAAAAYPLAPEAVGEHAVRQALQDVGLGLYADRLDDPDTLKRLSGGERQRLALARVLIHRPAWVFLDESTSALDSRAEADLMNLIQERLPDITLVVIAHRQPVGVRGLVTLDIEPLRASARSASMKAAGEPDAGAARAA